MDPDLVNRIVEQVKAALARGAGGGADARSAEAVPQSSPSASTGPARAERASHVGAPPGSTGGAVWNVANAPRAFVTAEMLQQRLAGGVDKGVVELAPNEVLTPNAVDYAEQKRLTVRKAAAGLQPGARPPQQAAPPGGEAGPTAAVGIVVDRGDDKVASTLAAVSRAGVELVDYSQTDCVLRNLQALCEAVRQGRVCCGVAIAPYAAGPMALASGLRGIRAVQGTRVESVAAAVRQFHANLLVLEHAFCTFHEMRRMVQAFAERPAGPPTDKTLADALARRDGAGGKD